MGRQTLLAALLALLLFFPGASAYSQVRLEDASNTTSLPYVELEGPYNNYKTQSRDIGLEFYFRSGESGILESLCTLYVNSELIGSQRVKQGALSSFAMQNLSRKAHKWQVFCKDSQSDIWSFEILEPGPPSVRAISPPESYSAQNGSATFTFEYRSGADELPMAECGLVVNNIVQKYTNASDGRRTSIYADLPPGNHLWAVQCARPSFPIYQKPVESEYRLVKIPLPPPQPVPAQNTSEPSPPPPPLPKISASILSQGGAGNAAHVLFSDENSTPLSNHRVFMVSPGGEEYSATTDSLGRASFVPDSEGEYTFRAQGRNMSSGFTMHVGAPPPSPPPLPVPPEGAAVPPTQTPEQSSAPQPSQAAPSSESQSSDGSSQNPLAFVRQILGVRPPELDSGQFAILLAAGVASLAAVAFIAHKFIFSAASVPLPASSGKAPNAPPAAGASQANKKPGGAPAQGAMKK